MAHYNTKKNNLNKLNIKQFFIQFLKQNNVYEKYMLNFNNRNKMSKYYRETPFMKYFMITHDKYLIANAFPWTVSPEKFGFWEDTDDKWIMCLHDYYEKNNIK